ncbi:hypothetical protein RU98_GL001859 [Enterococcus caccae]|nr:hypothetical protein RU98_GL001859 [Enterococcus caccae]
MLPFFSITLEGYLERSTENGEDRCAHTANFCCHEFKKN